MAGRDSQVPLARAMSLPAVGPGGSPNVGERRRGRRVGIGLEGATDIVVGDRGCHPLGPQRRRPTPQLRCAPLADRPHAGLRGDR
jgi:hypothetical protein